MTVTTQGVAVLVARGHPSGRWTRQRLPAAKAFVDSSDMDYAMQCLYRFLSVFHVLLMWFACLRSFSSELQQATFWKQIGSLHCTGMSFSGIVQCFQASTARGDEIRLNMTCTTVRPVRPYDWYDCHHCQITAVYQVLAFVACCHTHWLWAWDSPRSSAWAKSSVWLGLQI